MKVVKTSVYDSWLRNLKRTDPRAAARVQVRIDRLVSGNPGDTAPIGSGLSELRIHHGPGFRVYYRQRGDVLLIILCGGDKSTQAKDIRTAHQIAHEWQEEHGED